MWTHMADGVLRQLTLRLLRFFSHPKEASPQLKLSRTSQGWMISLEMVSNLFLDCLQSQ